jgi:protein SCO1/2
MKSNLLALLLLGILLIVGLVFGIYQAFFAAPSFNGTVIDPPVAAPEFSLDSDQGPVKLTDFQGKFVLLYFGYSYCPDVCPSTLSDMKRVVTRLDPQADRVQGIYISVDPRRDTPGRMGEFSRFYHPSFIGLSGTMEAISQTAAAYGIIYRYNDAESASNYTVDHTSRITVIDPQGRTRLYWEHGTTSDQMIDDLRHLLQEN